MIFHELSDTIEIETWLKKCPISESYRAMAHWYEVADLTLV